MGQSSAGQCPEGDFVGALHKIGCLLCFCGFMIAWRTINDLDESSPAQLLPKLTGASGGGV